MGVRARISAITRERLLRYLRILFISGFIGAVYGMRVGVSASLAVSGLIGVVNGVLIAGCIAGIEIFALRSKSLRLFFSLPFILLFALKTLTYAAIAAAVLASEPGERLVGLAIVFDTRNFTRTIWFSLMVTTVFMVLLQAASLVGYRTFRNLLLGKYHRPHPERRFFLFVDVVGSTALAERLGPLAMHRILSEIFAAVAEPIAACRGEIYQYVGDEIVVTWTEDEGSRDARPVRCFFEICAALAARENEFRLRFGIQAELRAALHLGEVIAGEVGEERRAIVFHGDVMNTASRLEQATRELGFRFIASAEAIQALGILSDLKFRDLGALALRGRKEPLHAYGIEQFNQATIS